MNSSHTLLVAQWLLAKAGSRLKIKKPLAGGEGYDRFQVFGAGWRKSVVMPVVLQTTHVAILSLLRESGAGVRTWLFNGQASRGMSQIADYGHSGAVTVRQSKTELLRIAGHDLSTMSRPFQDLYQVAPDSLTLVVYGPDDLEEQVVLPSEVDADLLVEALSSTSPISVGTRVEAFQALVKTFSLDLCFGEGDLYGFMFSRETQKASKLAA